MSYSEEKCPSCQGPLGPWSVTANHDGRTETACSDACATAIGDGHRIADAKAEDYTTMAIGVDVLRKALLRNRG
jgi:hypothetical protein